MDKGRSTNRRRAVISVEVGVSKEMTSVAGAQIMTGKGQG